MEPEVSLYKIGRNTSVNPDSADDIFTSSSAGARAITDDPINTSTSSTAPPPMPTAEDQLMSSYISSPNPDVPNQYNIIIAADDEEHSSLPSTIQQVQQMPAATAPYRSYTVQFKLDALDWYYQNGQNKNVTAKMFGVDRKRIRDWLQDETNLRSDPTPETTKRKRTNCLPQYKEIEAALYRWYIEQRENGRRPKNAALRAKSLEYAVELGYRDSFKASVHWLCNWKRRNKISFVPSEPSNEEDEDSAMSVPNILDDQLGDLESLAQNFKSDGIGNSSLHGNSGPSLGGSLHGNAGTSSLHGNSGSLGGNASSMSSALHGSVSSMGHGSASTMGSALHGNASSMGSTLHGNTGSLSVARSLLGGRNDVDGLGHQRGNKKNPKVLLIYRIIIYHHVATQLISILSS